MKCKITVILTLSFVFYSGAVCSDTYDTLFPEPEKTKSWIPQSISNSWNRGREWLGNKGANVKRLLRISDTGTNLQSKAYRHRKKIAAGVGTLYGGYKVYQNRDQLLDLAKSFREQGLRETWQDLPSLRTMGSRAVRDVGSDIYNTGAAPFRGIKRVGAGVTGAIYSRWRGQTPPPEPELRGGISQNPTSSPLPDYFDNNTNETLSNIDEEITQNSFDIANIDDDIVEAGNTGNVESAQNLAYESSEKINNILNAYGLKVAIYNKEIQNLINAKAPQETIDQVMQARNSALFEIEKLNLSK